MTNVKKIISSFLIIAQVISVTPLYASTVKTDNMKNNESKNLSSNTYYFLKNSVDASGNYHNDLTKDALQKIFVEIKNDNFLKSYDFDWIILTTSLNENLEGSYSRGFMSYGNGDISTTIQSGENDWKVSPESDYHYVNSAISCSNLNNTAVVSYSESTFSTTMAPFITCNNKVVSSGVYNYVLVKAKTINGEEVNINKLEDGFGSEDNSGVIEDNWLNREVARQVAKPDVNQLTQADYESITDINLSSKSLSGIIPSDLNKLTNLVTLNLSENYLSGEIPGFIGNLPSLKTFDIRENEFTGEIPENISRIRNVDMYLNQLIGELPGMLPEESVSYNLISDATNQSILRFRDNMPRTVTYPSKLDFQALINDVLIEGNGRVRRVSPDYEVELIYDKAFFDETGRPLKNGVTELYAKIKNTPDTNVYTKTAPIIITIEGYSEETNSEITLSVTQDTTEPTNTGLYVYVSATSPHGINRIECNGTEISTSSTWFWIDTNGVYNFKAYNTNGYSKETSIVISNIDKEKPSLTLTPNTTENTNGSVLVSGVVTDNMGVSKVILPDGAEITDSSFTFEVTTNGEYTFKAIDLAGNETIKSILIDNINIGTVEDNWLNREIARQVGKSDIQKLTELDYASIKNISLASSNIEGCIPNDIDKLINLESLNLLNNSLTGHIPNSINNLPKLRMMYLSNNNFTGKLPNMSNIGTVYLSNNQFIGDAPSNCADASYNFFDNSSNQNQLIYTNTNSITLRYPTKLDFDYWKNYIGFKGKNNTTKSIASEYDIKFLYDETFITNTGAPIKNGNTSMVAQIAEASDSNSFAKTTSKGIYIYGIPEDVSDIQIEASPYTVAPVKGYLDINVRASSSTGIDRVECNGEVISDGTDMWHRVYNNGSYSYKAYNSKGDFKEIIINVTNIDNIPPILVLTSGVLDEFTHKVDILAEASDNTGVQKIILPDNSEVHENSVIFPVYTNGIYTFRVIDTVGNETVKSIEISNINVLEISLSSNRVDFGKVGDSSTIEKENAINMKITSSSPYSIFVKAVADIEGTTDYADSVESSRVSVRVDEEKYIPLNKSFDIAKTNLNPGVETNHSLNFKLNPVIGIVKDNYSMPLKIKVSQE